MLGRRLQAPLDPPPPMHWSTNELPILPFGPSPAQAEPNLVA